MPSTTRATGSEFDSNGAGGGGARSENGATTPVGLAIRLPHTILCTPPELGPRPMNYRVFLYKRCAEICSAPRGRSQVLFQRPQHHEALEVGAHDAPQLISYVNHFCTRETRPAALGQNVPPRDLVD